jgi:hypothetical protein
MQGSQWRGEKVAGDLPHAADTEIFYPRRAEKSVFYFWMGRRHEPLHQALLAYCAARGLRYLYSKDRFYSDEDLGRIASSARYFVVTLPDLDNPRPAREAGAKRSQPCLLR